MNVLPNSFYRVWLHGGVLFTTCLKTASWHKLQEGLQRHSHNWQKQKHFSQQLRQIVPQNVSNCTMQLVSQCLWEINCIKNCSMLSSLKNICYDIKKLKKIGSCVFISLLKQTLLVLITKCCSSLFQFNTELRKILVSLIDSSLLLQSMDEYDEEGIALMQSFTLLSLRGVAMKTEVMLFFKTKFSFLDNL